MSSEASAPDAPAPPKRPLRVLWAEDNAIVADMIRKALGTRGYDCRIAANGTEALALVKANREQFDVIGTDFQMPGLDGLNLTRALRAEGFKGPIVVFASKLTEAVTEELRRYGVEEIFSKPAGFGAVLMALRSFAQAKLDSERESAG